MIKKLIALLLCLTLLFSFAACEIKPETDDVDNTVSNEFDDHETKIDSEDEDEDEDEGKDDDSETNPTEDKKPSYNYGSGDLVPLEYRFDEDDDGYTLIQSLQGKIQYADNGEIGILFTSGNVLYQETVFNSFLTPMELPVDQSVEFVQFKYCSNSTIGASLLCFTDTELFVFDEDGAYLCNNITIDMSKDILGVYECLGSPWVMTKDGDGYTITQWNRVRDEETREYIQNEDGSYKYVVEGKKPLGKIFTNDKTDIANGKYFEEQDITDKVVSIFNIDDRLYGYRVVVITDSGDMYYVDKIENGNNGTYDLHARTYEPVLSNVNQLYTKLTSSLAEPLHSVIGDDSAVYSRALGESMFDSSDDVDVKFLMPEGHTTSDLVDIFDLLGGLIFVFENGDVYYTGSISNGHAFMDDLSGEYTLTKHNILSAAMQAGNVKQIFGMSSAMDKGVYVLNNDGTLWICKM